MAMGIPGQQAGIVALAVVKVANHMHGPRMRRPHAKRRAIGDEIGAHRGVRANMFEGGGHGTLVKLMRSPL